MIEIGCNSYFTNSLVVDTLSIIIKSICDNEYKNDYVEESILNDIKSDVYIKEVLSSFKLNGLEFLEFLMYIDDFNDFEQFKKIILESDEAEYLYILSGYIVDKTYIDQLLNMENGLVSLFNKTEICSSILSFEMIIKNRESIVNRIIDYMKCMVTDSFISHYKNITKSDCKDIEMLSKMLSIKAPLEVSQDIMGKKFYNKGPYNKFIFIHSSFITRKCIRYFKHDQILVYSSLADTMNSEEIANVLRVISDATRFQIIDSLSENNSFTGKELSEKLKLSKPTISHHIDILKEAGLINEERNKNSKLYSLNYKRMNDFIRVFSDKFKR